MLQYLAKQLGVDRCLHLTSYVNPANTTFPCDHWMHSKRGNGEPIIEKHIPTMLQQKQIFLGEWNFISASQLIAVKPRIKWSKILIAVDDEFLKEAYRILNSRFNITPIVMSLTAEDVPPTNVRA